MTFFLLCCMKLSFNVTFFPSRITDNLLAMARPSTEIIEKYSIIEQFRRYSSLCLPHNHSLNLKPCVSMFLYVTCFHLFSCGVLSLWAGAAWRPSSTCSGLESTPAVAIHWSRRAASPTGPRPSWRQTVSFSTSRGWIPGHDVSTEEN